jgi:hypothetical protein
MGFEEHKRLLQQEVPTDPAGFEQYQRQLQQQVMEDHREYQDLLEGWLETFRQQGNERGQQRLRGWLEELRSSPFAYQANPGTT